jgi:hypothetical protein
VQLKADHLGNCMQVRTSAGIGTCFYRKVFKRGGFLSAAHVFRNVQAGETVYFHKPGEWVPHTIKEIVHQPDGHDVCAFTVEDLVFDTPDANLRLASLWPGDGVRFLGFPHGLSNTYPSQTGYSTPLTRNAHLSGAIIHNGIQLTVLDGFNNPGYSGGPVFADAGDGVPTLIGVISGYRNEERFKSLVYRLAEDGTELAVEGYFVKPNSGMILAVQSVPVFETFDSLTTSNAPS